MNGARRRGGERPLSELFVSLRGEGRCGIELQWLTGGGARGREEDYTGSQVAGGGGRPGGGGSLEVALGVEEDGACGVGQPGCVSPTGGGSPEAAIRVEEDGTRKFGRMTASKSNHRS
jgi:hypothetical protein